MDIGASSFVKKTKVISKATAAKKSGNWYIWYTFLKNTCVEEKSRTNSNTELGLH